MRPATMVIAAMLVTCAQAQRPEPDAPSRAFELAAADNEIFVCVTDPAMGEHIRALMESALDDAMKDAVQRAFEIWMKDPTDQPRRAGVGVRRAVSAYIQSREKLAQWQPMLCAWQAP